MEIKEAQDKIQEFDKARGWDNQWNMKDLLPNITEEGGEMWNLVMDNSVSYTTKFENYPDREFCTKCHISSRILYKWIDNEKQKKVAQEHIAEVSDYVGGTLYLILKIANQTGIDASQALQNTLDEYEKRMPAATMKIVGHANKRAGGVDNN